jgi:hypothetical protein
LRATLGSNRPVPTIDANSRAHYISFGPFYKEGKKKKTIEGEDYDLDLFFSDSFALAVPLPLLAAHHFIIIACSLLSAATMPPLYSSAHPAGPSDAEIKGCIHIRQVLH